MTEPLSARGLIVLDRDGVINQDSVGFIKSVDEWLPLDGSIEAIAALSCAGFTVAVASNQSGLGRGFFDDNALLAMHRKLRKLVTTAGGEVGQIVVCPHLPGDGCACRKPAPGLLIRLGDYYNAPLREVPVIGDSLRDLQAAMAAGARPILVRSGNGIATQEHLPAEFHGIDVFDNLAAAAAALIAR